MLFGLLGVVGVSGDRRKLWKCCDVGESLSSEILIVRVRAG